MATTARNQRFRRHGAFGSPKALAVLGSALILAGLLAAPAEASPVCAHRGADHAAQHHETREGDSRWHELHGDLPTCNLDKPDDVDDKDHERDDPRWRVHHDDKHESNDPDDHEIPRRDHEGFHCTWHGCG